MEEKEAKAANNEQKPTAEKPDDAAQESARSVIFQKMREKRFGRRPRYSK